MEAPTIDETKNAYNSVYGEICSSKEATQLADEFVSYRKVADNLDLSVHGDMTVIDPKTIEEFVEHRKKSDKRKSDSDAYREKLDSLSGIDRFLLQEGLANDFGHKIQAFIDGSSQGQSTYAAVRVGRKESEGVASDIRFVVSNLCRFVDHDGFDSSKIDGFISDEGKRVASWFEGIWGDGERTLRTIHIIARMFDEYCSKN